jgi:hypothetical protein
MNCLIRSALENKLRREPSDRDIKGLVIVCGETGSRKSSVADGLLRALVRQKLSAGAHNHIIALGNPVDWVPYHPKNHAESDSSKRWDGDLQSLVSAMGIRYTPRVLSVDTDLEHALIDALRQKPAAVYVDEIRNDQDWKPLLRFAQTGHLIVTTAHAAGVSDLLLWLFQCMRVRGRSQAPAIARNLLAVVHSEVISGETAPELWLSANAGAAALGAYGPGALVPAHSDDAALIAREYILSRVT